MEDVKKNQKKNLNKKKLDPNKVIKEIEKKVEEGLKNIKNEKEIKKAQKEISKEIENRINYLEKHNVDNKNARYILERGNRLLVKDEEILRLKSIGTLKDEAFAYFEIYSKDEKNANKGKNIKNKKSDSIKIDTTNDNAKKQASSGISKNKETVQEKKIVYYKHKEQSKSLILPLTIGLISILIIVYLVKKHVRKNN